MVVYETQNQGRWFRVDSTTGTRTEIAGPGGGAVAAPPAPVRTLPPPTFVQAPPYTPVPPTPGEFVRPPSPSFDIPFLKEVEPVVTQDPYGLYDYGTGPQPLPDTGFPGTPTFVAQRAAAGVFLVTGSMLIRALGPFAGRAAMTLLRALGVSRIAWSSIPGWIQQALVGLGAAQGVDIVLDAANIGPDGGGLPGIFPTFDLLPDGPASSPYPGGVPPIPPEAIGSLPADIGGATVVGGWVANGTPFVRLSNGRLGARNKKGVWKFWTPKKPIVIYATGAADLRHLTRAERAVNNQVKKISEMVSRRKPRTVTKCFRCQKTQQYCKCG